MGRIGRIGTVPRCASGLLALAVAFSCNKGAVACEAGEAVADVRYNAESDRLYLEGSGCITPRDIFEAKNASASIPIEAITEDGEISDVETGFWLFTSDVYIYNGVKLELHKDSGCSGMRLSSDDDKFIELRAHGGWLSMLSTEVSAWDVGKADHRSNYTGGRSYVTAISERLESPAETCVGHAKNDAGEARMDIVNSEVHHLGYKGTEAYGVVWKVRGFCVNKTNEYLFDDVNVRGNIRFSDIHHNYFGMYSYGHTDGLWEYNLMRNNAEYGFDPHDDSDNLRIHNNVVYENGNHGIIASKRCNDVSIQNNVVFDNENAGIMLHRSSNYAIVRNNTITNNGDSCIAIFESNEGDYSNNTCIDNYYGIRWSVGSSYNKVYDNYIQDSTQYGLYFYKGSDDPDVVDVAGVPDGYPAHNFIADNHINGATEGMKMGETVGNQFSGNVFENVADMRFRVSTDIKWLDNTIDPNASIEVDDACFTASSDLTDVVGPVCS